MRKGLFLTVILFMLSPLSGQDLSEISNIDIIVILEEINQKLDDLKEQQTLESEQRLSVGLIPLSVRSFLDMDVMDQYLSGQGDFEALNNLMVPLSNGYELGFRYGLTPFFSLGLQGAAHSSSSLGLHGIASDYVAMEASDFNNDDYSDSYSHVTYFLSSIQLTGLFQIPLIENLMAFDLGASAGLSKSRIYFSNSISSFWSGLIGTADAEAQWNRRELVIGGFTGLQFKLKSLLLDFHIGFDYYIPLEDWSPDFGIDITDTSPPGDFSPYNFWITLSPSFLF